MGFAISQVSDIASPIIETNISVTTTRTLITVNAPKKTIEIYNDTDSAGNIYYGDVTVDGDTTGIAIVPGETKIFAAVENGFKIYLVTKTGETATARIITYKGR